MPVGKVKWFDRKKGFGFIADGDGRDIFVHYTMIEGDGFRHLRDGESVEYEASQGPKGYLATRVKRLSEDGHPGADGDGHPGPDGRPKSDGQ